MPKLSEVMAAPQQGAPLKLSQIGAAAVPDFSNVRSGSSSTEAYAPTDAKVAAERAADVERYNPTKGMSPADLQKTGFITSLTHAGKGAQQLQADFAAGNLGAIQAGLRALGLDRAADAVMTYAAAPAERYRRGMQADVNAMQEQDAPVLATGHGLAGNIAGNVLQTLGPGVALRGTAPARLLLPTTVGGNVVQGAVMGAAQPVASDESRGANTAISAGLSAVLPGLAKVPGVVGGARKLLPAFSEGRQTQAAARVLEQFAENPAAVREALGPNAPSGVIVPGTRPTTAEVTQDVGLGGLQRFLGNTPEFAGPLTLQTEGNNLARVRAIEGAFGGANASRAAAATEARDLAARQALRPINSTGVEIEPVRQAITRIAIRNQSSQPVRDAMAALDAELPNIKTVRDAANLRAQIGRLMGGQIEGQAGAKFAQSQLATVRGILDRQMRQAFPEWGQFLRDYKAASREIDQINVGEALLDKGPNVRAVGDIPNLSPAKFAGAVQNLDDTVRSATGFRKATAARTLTPQQIESADAVMRDLERLYRTQTRGLPVNSATVSNAIGGNRLQDAAGPVGAAVLASPEAGVVMLGINAMRKQYGEATLDVVRRAMLDPAEAQRVLASLPGPQRQAAAAMLSNLQQAMTRVGGTAGAAAGTALAP